MSGDDPSSDPGVARRPDAEDTRTLSDLADHPDHARWSGGHLTPGQDFGQFEIQRLLGAGGMGEVYEAFDHGTGRYVAVKILNEALDDPEHRNRFVREGQLASRVSHPNSIYVYGTEEIDGRAVIIMELAAAGTLKDKVKADGPMQPREAVDAVLQILDGLEAAAAEGVLHRDIKPSNCFVEPDGTTKIGDFGLSISTLAREETQLTMSGSIVGTPAFASPEQLSGRALDVRADIYSIGATLFYLLTGRPPFQADRPVELIARVMAEPAPSVRKLQRKVPRGLARTVALCLSKDPSARFADHAALRHALASYGSGSLALAPSNLRFAAFGNDYVVILLVAMLADEIPALEPSEPWLLPLLFALPFVLVRALGEGVWGKSPGKAVLGLRVVGVGRARAGFVRALARNVLLIGPLLPGLVLLAGDPDQVPPGAALVSALWALAIWLGMRNGGVGPHDRLTGTRVIRDTTTWEQSYRAPDLGPPPALASTDSYVGPYRILEPRASDASGQTNMAFDDMLQRRLWVRVRSTGSPVEAVGRDRGGESRLRWINGRRDAEENWDAWEYVPGETPLSAARVRQRWCDVRGWLRSLAHELPRPDVGSAGSIGLANLWLAERGRAIVSAFPFEDPSSEAAPIGDAPARQRLLARVCVSLLEGRPWPSLGGRIRGPSVPMPLHARALVTELADGRLTESEAMVEIERTSRLGPEVSIGKRFFTLMQSAPLFVVALLPPFRQLVTGRATESIAGWLGTAADISWVMLAVGLLNLAGAFLLNRRVLLGAKVREGPWWGSNQVAFEAALVDTSGQELRRASRPLVIRTLVTWIPAWLAGLLFLAAWMGIVLPNSVWLLPPLLLLAGGFYALANPEQGIQDRIAGTYLVPR